MKRFAAVIYSVACDTQKLVILLSWCNKLGVPWRSVSRVPSADCFDWWIIYARWRTYSLGLVIQEIWIVFIPSLVGSCGEIGVACVSPILCLNINKSVGFCSESLNDHLPPAQRSPQLTALCRLSKW